jgi:transcriptional regulator of acetoin/glycerol metabolism
VDAAALLQALKESKWNKAEVARRFGISRQTLYRKLREAGLEDQ